MDEVEEPPSLFQKCKSALWRFLEIPQSSIGAKVGKSVLHDSQLQFLDEIHIDTSNIDTNMMVYYNKIDVSGIPDKDNSLEEYGY